MAEVGVWGTVLESTGWLRATAKIRVPINFQDFLHREQSSQECLGEGGKPAKPPPWWSSSESSHSLCVSRRHAPITKSVSLMEQSLKPLGKDSKPCSPQRQMRTHCLGKRTGEKQQQINQNILALRFPLDWKPLCVQWPIFSHCGRARSQRKSQPWNTERKDLPKTESEAGQHRINLQSLSQDEQELRNKEQRLAMEEREHVGRPLTCSPTGRA